MKNHLLKLVFAVVILTCSTASIAHHSFSATFDESKTITVEGVVTKFSFRNPHVLVYMDVKDKAAKRLIGCQKVQLPH